MRVLPGCRGGPIPVLAGKRRRSDLLSEPGKAADFWRGNGLTPTPQLAITTNYRMLRSRFSRHVRCASITTSCMFANIALPIVLEGVCMVALMSTGDVDLRE